MPAVSADMVLATRRLASEADTAAFGEALAPHLGPGDTVALAGEIGAGKSVLARALIAAKLRAAGAAVEEIPSPTFTLVQTYTAGSTEIWHADLYRLGDPDEAVELGLDAAFETALCLIEWPERLAGALPATTLWLHLDHGQEPGDAEVRRVRLSGLPERWQRRLADDPLQAAVAHG